MDKLFNIKNSINKVKMQMLHDFSCEILRTIGMRFLSNDIIDALEKNGSKVDRNSNTAMIPQKLIEEKLWEFSKEISCGRKHFMLNGGVAYDVGERILCKFGSIAPRFFSWDKKFEREATEEDLINSIRLGEAIDEIGMVGCPVYAKVIQGIKVNPNFIPIVNAMMLARYTKKLGNSEINSTKQLKYLIEIGIVIKGSLEAYKKNPCFLTAKESISPLLLDSSACEVLVALAKQGLPATMIPMPIMGASVPITISGAVAVTNAEILATMTALRCIAPDAMVGGGSMASYMDMRGKGIKFNVMDAIKVDLILCQLYKEFYKLDYGFGVYSSDSKSLGTEILIERLYKILGAFFVKKFNYVIGMYNQGMVFSPELAIIEIEMIKNLHELYNSFEMGDLNEEMIGIIKNVKPGGNFMGEMHTLNNLRKTLRSKILEEDYDINNKKKINDIFEKANQSYKDILKNKAVYILSEDKQKEIDKIVTAAHKDIVGVEW
jgi:trimethylamine--corrinoid protein Co-methyltransferase